jgi:hypothetical protein
MTEREQLLAMLSHARVQGKHSELTITDEGPLVQIHTGPDDSVANFGFGADGRLYLIEVRES